MSSTARRPTGNAAAISIRRLVNDEIARVAGGLGGRDGSLFEFICECGDLRCRGMVKLTLAEYLASRPGSVVGHA